MMFETRPGLQEIIHLIWCVTVCHSRTALTNLHPTRPEFQRTFDSVFKLLALSCAQNRERQAFFKKIWVFCIQLSMACTLLKLTHVIWNGSLCVCSAKFAIWVCWQNKAFISRNSQPWKNDNLIGFGHNLHAKLVIYMWARHAQRLI